MINENLVNIGLGNYVLASRLVAILNPSSSPMRRLREDAKAESRLVDASQGRKTRSILVLDSNHVLLSSVLPDTIAQRYLDAVHSEEKSTKMYTEDNEMFSESDDFTDNIDDIDEE